MKLNQFLLNVIKNEENLKPEQAFENIITNNARGIEKCIELGTYDAESLLGGKIIPGNIYKFTYKANEVSKFKIDNEHTLEWFDSYPIVLVTYVDKEIIKGVNFNLCNKAVKSGILNMMTNIDPDFYETGAEEQVAKGKFPVSENVQKLILSGEIENMLVQSLKIDYSTIFRHYKIQNIANIRLIEYWQWKYLPYLNYNGSIKGDVLKIIQHVTGIDRYKM